MDLILQTHKSTSTKPGIYVEIAMSFAKLNPETPILQTVHFSSFPASEVLTELNGAT